MLVIGVPICRCKSYIIKLFLYNQVNIKKETIIPTKILFAVDEPDFEIELRELLKDTNLDYEILTVKPEEGIYYKLKNTTNAREAIRKRFLEIGEYLLFIDSDTLIDPNGINLLLYELYNYDVVYNSYIIHIGKLCNNGLGLCLIRKRVLEKVKFRYSLIPCKDPTKPYDFNSCVDECLYFELDALNKGFRIKRGCFITNCHYSDEINYLKISPCKRTRKEKILHSYLVRRFMSLFVNYERIMLKISSIQFNLHMILR